MPAGNDIKESDKEKMSEQGAREGLVKHTGGCHCGAVTFEVLASPHLQVYDCNCSICKKKGNIHFMAPHPRFKLLQGSEQLTTYTFNTGKAKHMFCKVCGVQSFYQPRSNPDCYGVNPNCLDPGTVVSRTVVNFDGTNWEKSMQEETNKPVIS